MKKRINALLAIAVFGLLAAVSGCGPLDLLIDNRGGGEVFSVSSAVAEKSAVAQIAPLLPSVGVARAVAVVK